MNFRQLIVFYEVAKTGSLSAAAENLFLTQPAVTWQIKNLEAYYGLKFFERTGKKVILTNEGKVLYDFADQIFKLADHAEEAIEDLRGFKRGKLRIDSVFTFGDYYLPLILSEFHKKYPKIELVVNTGNTSQVIENTLLRKNDIAFIAYHPENDKLMVREFVSDLLIGIVSHDHPFAMRDFITLKELNGQPLILREQGSSPRRILDEIFREKGISPTIIMELASTLAIKKAVEAGLGIGILSRQAAEKEMRDGVLKGLRFSDVEIRYQFFLIHHKDKYLSSLLQTFLDMSIEYASKLSEVTEEMPWDKASGANNA